jgi:hypothetical protein
VRIGNGSMNCSKIQRNDGKWRTTQVWN